VCTPVGSLPTMPVIARRQWIRSTLVVAIVYAVIGVVTADLSGSASTPQMRTAWRLAAWLLSFVAFAGHLVHEEVRLRSAVRSAAGHAAAAVALGAFLLAAVGPVLSHWGAADFLRTSLLSLGLWPILAGVPAFLVALVAGSTLRRLVRLRGA